MGREEIAAPATVLAARIAAREVSAEEVVAAHVVRIAEVDGAVNAVVQIDAERSLAAAREADAALARGEPAGPLHGVPFTVKDNISAAGLAMAIGAPERAGVVRGRRRDGRRPLQGGRRDPPRQDQLPALRRRDRDGQRGLRPDEQPVRPGAHARRQQRRRGGHRRRAGLAVRRRHRLGRQRPPPRPLLRPGLPQADRPPRAGHRRARRRGPDRRARRPAHPARADGALGRPTWRCCCGSSPAPTGATAASPPVPLGDPEAVALRGLRVAVHTDDGLRHSDAETVAAVERRGRRAAGRGRRGGRGAPAGRRPRAHHRGLALLRRRAQSAELYRLLRRWDAYRGEMLAFAERHELILSPVFPDPARRHGTMNVPGRDRSDELHDAAQPHRLAGRHGPLRDLARGPADRRPARRAAVARRRGARRRGGSSATSAGTGRRSG